jgi:muramidase (phage lysozyme)
MDPRRQALLNTIRYAEGTWKGGSKDGYRVMFGGGMADPSRSGGRHPDTVINGGRVSSAAAGAYQFMPDTWAEAAKASGVRADQFFDPAAQDKVAGLLIDRRLGKTTLGDQLTPEVAAKLAPEWASFPTLSGGSAYANQSVKKLSELQKFYQQQLGTLRGGGGGGGATGGGAAASSMAAKPSAAKPSAAPASPQDGGPPLASAGQSRPPASLDLGGLFRGTLQQLQRQTAGVDADIDVIRQRRRMAGSPNFLQQVMGLMGPALGRF